MSTHFFGNLKHASRLNDTLVQVLRQHENGLDIRHLYTFAGMMAGLIQWIRQAHHKPATISCSAWVPYVNCRAQYAQSTQRRLARWQYNKRIEVHSLYAPLIPASLQNGGEHTLYLALDTTLLWGQYCVIRIA